MPATTKQTVRDRYGTDGQTERPTNIHNMYKQNIKQNANCTHFNQVKPAASSTKVIAIFRQSKISHRVDKGSQW